MWFSSDDTQADAPMTYICCSQENPRHTSRAKLQQQQGHFIDGFENYGHQLLGNISGNLQFLKTI